MIRTVFATAVFFMVAGFDPVFGQNTEVSPPVVQPVSIGPAASLTIDALAVKDMDVADVMRVIAQKTGLKIEVAPDIQGQAKVNLKDVSVDDAMRIILEPNNLAYEEKDGTLRVMTAPEFVHVANVSERLTR